MRNAAMTNTLKSISLKFMALAVFAGLTSLAMPAAVQAQELFYQDGTLVGEPSPIQVGGYYDQHGRFYQHRPQHRQNGFSLEFQFGQPPVFHQPRHPRAVYRQRPVIHISQAHVNWCYNRYRTYDHRSNSFVIRHGQRAYCVSPFSY